MADAQASGDVPTFELNLDLSPLERWHTIAAAYVDAFDTMVAAPANAELIGALQNVPTAVALLARRALPPRQREDVLALESLLGLPRGFLSLLQLVYEVRRMGERWGGGMVGWDRRFVGWRWVPHSLDAYQHS